MTTVNQNVDTMLNKIDSLNLTGASASAAANTKQEIETLFGEIGTFNEGDAGAEKIAKQIATLQEKIADLEESAQKILENIEEKNADVQKNSKALADAAAKLTDANENFQAQTADAARAATQDAINSYKQGKGETSFKECFNQAFHKRLGGLQGCQTEIQALYDMYDARKGAIDSIAGDIESALNQVDGLESQLQNINATISLLTRTKNIMEQSTVDDAYKNIDTDTNVPIYSGAKADIANALLAKYQSRNITEGDAAKATAGTGVSQEQKDAAANKWLEQKDGTYTSGDRYSAQQNPELMNLRNLVANGMITDLQDSGMNVDEIMTFVSTNWKVGISKQADGTWKIPKGHSSDAWVKEPAFEALTKLVTDSKTAATADDVNQNQLAELQKAVNEDGILKTMYEGGFTFKEAMYTLQTLFPDAGITYQLGDQAGTRTYSLVKDTDSSNGVFSKISTDVLNYWNVGSATATKGDDSTNGEVTKYDPITFQDGNTTYTFLSADALEDGKFDYKDGNNNDLLGSKEGISELLAFDLDGNGKIEGDELKNVVLMANNQQESVGTSKDVDGYKDGSNYKGEGAYTNAVDFHVSYSTAADLGITSIDVSKLQQGTGQGEELGESTRTYDGYQEEYEDINGSSVINTFTVTKGGKNLEGKETLNTASNLETFYGQIANDANAGQATIKASDKDIASAFDDAAGQGSDVIDNVRATLEQLRDSQPVDATYGDITLTEDDVHNITGLAYLNGVRDAARIAAEQHIDKPSDAKDAAEDAVNDYFETRIFGKNGVDEKALAEKKELEDNQNKDIDVE